MAGLNSLFCDWVWLAMALASSMLDWEDATIRPCASTQPVFTKLGRMAFVSICARFIRSCSFGGWLSRTTGVGIGSLRR